MSAEQVPLPLRSHDVGVASRVSAHPLSPLTSSEITNAVQLVQGLYPSNTSLQYKTVTLEEPKKAALVPYLDAEHNGRRKPSIDRRAFVAYYIRNTDKFHEAIVNLSRQRVENTVRLGPGVHGPGDAEEILLVEKIALEDDGVKAEIAKLKLPEGAAVISDPWIYGSDGVNDEQRMYQCFLYMRDPSDPSNLESNHYAFPLTISPVVDTVQWKVIRIDLLPTGSDHSVEEPGPFQIPPGSEYTPEHQKLRTDLKPLNVVQPEGASFRVTEVGETGRVLEWQKWFFRIGFNQREGMVIYDVRYDDRNLFYRMSLSDMVIPYADPRHPFHKKAAFDLGDAGAGVMANNLKLGCDCLGSIHYLSAVLSTDKGEPWPMENVVCIHEQDAGIGWKHTNYRTGTAALVRSRELVIQSIITVANYEYIMAFVFNQAGEVKYEVRATGVVSTQPTEVEVPWGTIVHPGVLAAHHQHIFSLRVDPAIDGHNNRLIYEEAHPMPRSEFNPHGVGYTVEQTLVEKSGGLDIDVDRNRTFKIQNTSSKNPINGKPVSYKIQAPPFQKLLADADSFHHKRAEFADHNLYVTKYRDGELYAGGKYTNQSRGGEGVRAWANRNENVKDTDLVVYVQFGLQHVTRVEDFPVMPCEIIEVAFKPVNFFDKNPALDVPPSRQEVNRSTLLPEQHHQPSVEAKVGENGKVCCSSKL
ncbi:MAG: hypothetical protein L6R40_002782 [Gallowayella cf. fulva]|nr:MAG: hypothetical protein L6R40_002782 [Xanthomendoza cf. fulva]